MTKKIKGQKVLDIIRAMLNMEKKGDIITTNNMDLYWLLTGSNKMKIAKAVQNEVPLDHIKELLYREESRLSLNDLLRKSVLDPNEEIPKDIHNDVEVSKWMVSRILVDKTTTLYDICIENYIKNRDKGDNKKAESNIKVFEFLLERRQLKTNFAELVVKIADYARSDPDFACELLDVIERHEYKDKQGEGHKIKDEINLNQNVFISKKILKSLKGSGANNNDVREPSVSSSNSQIFSSDRITELCRHSKQQEQGETMPLERFLDRVKTSKNPKIAAFAEAIISSKAEAIMPSENVVDPKVTQPKELGPKL